MCVVSLNGFNGLVFYNRCVLRQSGSKSEKKNILYVYVKVYDLKLHIDQLIFFLIASLCPRFLQGKQARFYDFVISRGDEKQYANLAVNINLFWYIRFS